jgi:hypothetical protein
MRKYPGLFAKVFLLPLMLLLLLSSCTVTAQTNQPTNKEIQEWTALLTPDSTLVRVGKSKEPVQTALLSRAALIASGLSNRQLASYEKKLDTIISEIVTKAKANTALHPAEAALVALHENGVLVSYDEDASTLTDIIDNGTFNCVSSAVLYLLIVKNLGIQAVGVDTPDHAFIMVKVNGRQVDVETTNRHGFDPGSKKDFKDIFGRVTGFSYVPPGEYAKREVIGEKALVALILSNRTALLEKTALYREALLLGVATNALRNDAKGLKFMLDRINNIMVDLNKKNDYSQAYTLAQAAFYTIGKLPELKKNVQETSYNLALYHEKAGRDEQSLEIVAQIKSLGLITDDLLEIGRIALHNLVQKHLRSEDIQGARQAYTKWNATVGEQRTKDLHTQITEAELIYVAQNKSFTEALVSLDRAIATGFSQKNRIEELLIFLYSKEANRIAATGDWLAAAAVSEEALIRLPGNIQLEQATMGFLRNYVVTVHNRFAQLFNSKQYDLARTEILAAMIHVPNNPTLLKDYDTVLAVLK